MTLRQTLLSLLEEEDDWYRDLLRTIAGHLNQTARQGALSAGDMMPDFILPNAEGNLVFSDDLLQRGPLVVCFFRGGWCPFCRSTLSALEAARTEIEAAGARLVAVSPATAGGNTETKRDLGLGFDVLSDVDCAVGLQFGTVYRVTEAYRQALESYDIDLVRQHGSSDLLLPMPAAFVVDRTGRIVAAHVSGDVTDRYEPADLAARLRALPH